MEERKYINEYGEYGFDALLDLYRGWISIEIDRDNKIDLGHTQEAWSDESYDAYGFTVITTIPKDFNSFFIKDPRELKAKARKQVVREKLDEIFAKPPESSWGQLRWSGGDKIETIYYAGRVSHKGLVVVNQSTRLCD